MSRLAETAETARSEAPSGYADLGGAFTPLYQRLKELGVAARIVGIGKIGRPGWGSNTNGQLGNNSTTNSHVAIQSNMANVKVALSQATYT